MAKSLLRLIPLDDMVVFPGMELTLPLDPGTDTRVLLLPRHLRLSNRWQGDLTQRYGSLGTYVKVLRVQSPLATHFGARHLALAE